MSEKKKTGRKKNTSRKKINVTSNKTKGKKTSSYKPDNSTATSALRKIKRLEEVHEQLKKEHKFMDSIAYWTFLIVALFTNFLISFLLIFLIIALHDPLLYVIIIIMGLGFGLVYSHIMHGLRHSFFHQHAFSLLFMIVTGGINVFFISLTSKIILDFYMISNSVYNTGMIGLAYFISYMVPYIVEGIVKKMVKK